MVFGRSDHMKQKNKKFEIISTIILTCFVFLFILEVIFRFLGFHGMNVNFEPAEYSESLGWKLKPNYREINGGLEWSFLYSTNSLGFRDIEHSIKNTKNKIRIVVLGDSQAEGWGVEFKDMWQEELLNKLNAKQSNYELINLGVRGYDIIQEYKQFLEVGILFEPDIVIQILHPNDFGFGQETIMGEMERYRPAYHVLNGEIIWEKLPERSLALISKNKLLHFTKYMFYKSAFITWCRYRLTAFSRVKNILVKAGLRTSTVVGNNYLSEDKYELNYGKAVEIIYQKFSLLQKEKQIKFFIIFCGGEIPPELRLSIENKLKYLLVIPLEHKYIWKYDGHPNQKGHQIIADKIYTWLSASGI